MAVVVAKAMAMYTAMVKVMPKFMALDEAKVRVKAMSKPKAKAKPKPKPKAKAMAKAQAGRAGPGGADVLPTSFRRHRGRGTSTNRT